MRDIVGFQGELNSALLRGMTQAVAHRGRMGQVTPAQFGVDLLIGRI